MTSKWGRMLRIIAGLALIYVGVLVMKNTPGYIIAIIGLAPLFAGIFDFCMFAPLFGMPFIGKEIRAFKQQSKQ